jgi:hypothetical protein
MCEEKVSTMPPRRCAETLVANQSIERDMRELRARLDAIEIVQRRSPDVRDIGDAESEEREVEEFVAKDVTEECLLKSVVKLVARENIVFVMYEGNLDTE